MSWRRCRLDWLTSEERGAVNPTEISADTVFHYSIPALDEIGDGRLEHPDEIGSGKLLLSGGEVLISKLNPRLPRVLLAEAHDVPTLASTEFIALRPGPNVDERFLRYWLGSEPLRQMLNGATMSVTRSQQRVRPEIVTKSWLRVPSIDDQRAIADYLDRETARIDALIDKKRRLKELLQERRQTLITEAISRSHDPGATARGDRVSWRRLKHYCDGPPEYGLSVSSDAYVDDGVRLLRTTDIDDDGALSPDSEGVFVGRHLIGPRHVLRPGDLLFSRAGSLGRCFRVPQEARDLTFAGYLVRFRPLPSFEPRYIEYCASAAFAQASIRADAVTSTISNFNAERYGNLLLPDSDPEQQRAIADYLDQETARIDALVERIDRQVALLQEHRQALITAAVTGELEIPGVAA